MFKLRHDWKKITTKAWSMRLMLLTTVLTGAEACVSYFKLLPFEPGTIVILALVVSIGAPLARLVAQKDFTDADQ